MFLLASSILSPIVPLAIGIKKRSTLLWIYPLVGLIFDMIVFALKRILVVSHQWPSNIFILLEFALVSFLYRDRIFKNDRLFYTVLFTFSAFFVFSTVGNSILQFNMLGTSIFAFVYIVYGILGFYSLLRKQDELFLDRSWFFWLNVALTMYASGTFLLFLFMDYLLSLDFDLFSKIWSSVFLTLNITKNLLIAVALYHYKPVARESH